MSDETEDLLERAFGSGATSITIRSRAPHADGYRASVDAHVYNSDGEGRTVSQLASASGEGATPHDALSDAIAKLASAPEIQAARSGTIEIDGPPPGAVSVPERRYAVAGRPGVFVTRAEASPRADTQKDRALRISARLDAVLAAGAPETAPADQEPS